VAAGRSAAWAVHQLFGTPGDWTDAACDSEETVAAALASLSPNTLALGSTHKFGVDGRKHRFVLEAHRQLLDTTATGHGHNCVGTVDHWHKFFHILGVALSLKGMLTDFNVAAIFQHCHLESRCEESYFFSTACGADGYTLITAKQQYPLERLNVFNKFF
jgi:hypothetical protein